MTVTELLSDHSPRVRRVARSVRRLVRAVIPDAAKRVYPAGTASATTIPMLASSGRVPLGFRSVHVGGGRAAATNNDEDSLWMLPNEVLPRVRRLGDPMEPMFDAMQTLPE
jgi:hypothetical protein